jgi:hypothetical protein
VTYAQSLSLLKRLAYLHGKHIYDDFHTDPNIKIVKEGLVHEDDLFVYYHDRPHPIGLDDAMETYEKKALDWCDRTGLNHLFFLDIIEASIKRGWKAAIAGLKRKARNTK